MTPPDLLVPLACIPETLPAGLPYRCVDADGAPADDDVETLTEPGHGEPYALANGYGWSLDLSSPPTDAEGRPTRLDAFGWAVSTLGRRLGLSGRVSERLLLFGDASLRVESLALSVPGAAVSLVGPQCCTAYVEGTGGHDGGFLRLVDPWPDLDGLDEDRATRAIVAAALRARVGLEGGGDV